jgi:hypothetical protein
MKYRRVVKTKVHMLKEQKNRIVITRCLTEIALKPGQALPEIYVTGWERDVTCPGCSLGAATS